MISLLPDNKVDTTTLPFDTMNNGKFGIYINKVGTGTCVVTIQVSVDDTNYFSMPFVDDTVAVYTVTAGAYTALAEVENTSFRFIKIMQSSTLGDVTVNVTYSSGSRRCNSGVSRCLYSGW